ncbi:hypothetical protein [Methylophilus sp. 3sh_L]|uniref:hypothetical protein n=1 Tax=Methylophilus sp. 3sh_L TaxID=3377114 RepID=UPI00398EC1BF
MIGKTKASRILLSWNGSPEQAVGIAYDTKTNSILWELTDYSIHLQSSELLNAKTVRNELYLLKGFVEHLLAEGKGYTDIDDVFLKVFKESEFKKILDSANGSKCERVAKRTVNAKLRRTYQFLHWLQESEKQVVGIIGEWDCPVTSALASKQQGSVYRPLSRSGRTNSRLNYPLLFRSTGSNGLPSQYEASHEDVALLTEMFHSEFSPYCAQRNILMMDLACEIGWRRGSINSLTCDQFLNLNLLDSAHDSYVVVPPSQKFGYVRQFEVPFRLAFRVVEFIETHRKELLSKNGWTEASAENRIFLSEREGRPLRDSTISTIYGSAFRKLGRPRGASTHSFRRRNVNDQVDKELQSRLELGLDTSELSITTAVAFNVGQSRPESLRPYVNRRIGRMVRQREQIKENQLRALMEENDELKGRVAELEKSKTKLE